MTLQAIINVRVLLSFQQPVFQTRLNIIDFPFPFQSFLFQSNEIMKYSLLK